MEKKYSDETVPVQDDMNPHILLMKAFFSLDIAHVMYRVHTCQGNVREMFFSSQGIVR